MEEGRKSFREKIKSWTKEQKRTHYNAIEEYISVLKENVKLKELGLELYKKNPFPINPQFEYERDEEYVKQKVKLTEIKLNQELKKEKDELKEFEWQMQILKSQMR